jgi:hypothetical protein
VDHKSAIVCTVSPTAYDLEHTINSLDHVSLTSSDRLTDRKWKSPKLDIPLADEVAFAGKPVHLWTSEEIRTWIDVAEGGRYSMVVLPPGLDGLGILQMGAKRLCILPQ